jgi:ketosteroid isomerase-like protein
VQGYGWYDGTLSVDQEADSFTVQIESSSSAVLVDQQVVRNYRITDDELVITPEDGTEGLARDVRARPRVTPTIHRTHQEYPVARAPQETIDLLNDYFGALEAKDFDRLRGFYAEDVALTFANHPTITGAKNVLALMADLAGKLDRIEHRLLRVWQEDEGVVVLEVRCIYHLNDGAVIEITACSIFVSVDGRFADMRLYVDHATVDAVLG